MKFLANIALLLLLPMAAFAQDREKYVSTTVQGKVVQAIVIDGDTVPVVDIDTLRKSEKRHFKSMDEHRFYLQARYNALKVYPYAAEAIKIYRQTQDSVQDMRNGKKKKYTKKKEEELSMKYEKELKKLTKVQGYILIKMIEREVKVPFYDVVSELRGGWAAFKWQSIARMYGFNLKKGYDPNADPLLESILDDLRIDYKR